MAVGRLLPSPDVGEGTERGPNAAADADDDRSRLLEISTGPICINKCLRAYFAIAP